MDNNSTQQSPTEEAAAAAAAAAAATETAAQSAAYPPQTPYDHLLQHEQRQLQMFWNYQRQEVEHANDFKNHQLPLARIKKIMKADEDVHMISAEAPVLFAKACEFFIQELTIRSWLHAEDNKRRTLQKNDIAAAISHTDIYDFLVDTVPREEVKDEGAGPGLVGPTSASGVPYYYPPLVQPATSMYVHPPPSQSQAWSSVWQTSEDHSYPSGGASSSGQGDDDGQI